MVMLFQQAVEPSGQVSLKAVVLLRYSLALVPTWALRLLVY